MKICSKCKTERPLTEFNKQKGCLGGLAPSCRKCLAIYKREWREANLSHHKAKSAEWRAKNPEKSRLLSKKWRDENPERVKSWMAAHYLANSKKRCAETAIWAQANKEKVSAYKAAYKARNPEKTSAARQNRRALLKGCAGQHTGGDIKSIFENQKGLCASCAIILVKSGKNKYHVDHIMPLALGGGNDKYNIQCLCPGCNLKKNAKHPVEWAKQQGKLL